VSFASFVVYDRGMIKESLEWDEKPIAAIATPVGYGGISVVRISGANVFQIADRLIGGNVQKISERKNGTFFYSTIYDCETGESIDDALILVFHAPRSYTGEDTVEIQGHGGVIPAQRLLNTVLKAGARLASPGEFTKRSFLNGNIDLTQAEAVCDLIQSQTDRAASVAKSQLDGALGNKIHGIYENIVDISSDLEHILDFDDGDLADNFIDQTVDRIIALEKSIEDMIGSWREGELLRQGVLIVLSGAPNAGKSSLLNALLERNRAIVHDTPGTTRDIIEESYSLSGIPVRLVDTAGLRDSDNEIECEGIRRAHALIDQADLNLLVIDRHNADQQKIDLIINFFDTEKLILVYNKSDLPAIHLLDIPPHIPIVSVSALQGDGLENLKEKIKNNLGIKEDFQTQPVITQRHLEELRVARMAVGEALQLLKSDAVEIVIAANLLREGAESLGRITGRIYSEDLLDNIFGKFCVGK